MGSEMLVVVLDLVVGWDGQGVGWTEEMEVKVGMGKW
jgi:hypothetical protein